MKSIADFVASRVQTETKFLVCAPVDNALFVQYLKDTSTGLVDEVKHVLIVGEGDELPENSLTFILLLFQFKHKLVKLLLKRLICVVDAELLKCIYFECLKAKNIKNTCKMMQ